MQDPNQMTKIISTLTSIESTRVRKIEARLDNESSYNGEWDSKLMWADKKIRQAISGLDMEFCPVFILIFF